MLSDDIIKPSFSPFPEFSKPPNGLLPIEIWGRLHQTAQLQFD